LSCSRSPFSDQRLQVGFKTGTILARVLNDQLDESPLARSIVSVNASACQAVKDLHRLLGEDFFKFVGGHFFPVKGET
jgi:hypothetical protein